MKKNINPLAFPIGIPYALQFLQNEIRKVSAQRMVIAIDGHSSSGKSTIAKQIAELLGYIFVDSGAMYRAVTLHLMDNNIPIDNEELVLSSLDDVNIGFERSDNGMRTLLNGRDVEADIRTMSVSEQVSPVATISGVRSFLVRQQRTMADQQGIVMDGRDIGTVVFPNADVKIFITASIAVRTERRYNELRTKGIEIDKAEIRQNLQERDHIDSTREDSPLRQAEDAVLLDTSELDPTLQLQKSIEIIIKAGSSV
ncbi:MAG: cytidylate kinase [Saprospiraceae bacterium]|jgi:cytidylate kinase